MNKKSTHTPADYIVPLNMNGLQGRMLYMPAPAKQHKREILLLCGQHTMIERWWGLIQNLNVYGAVTVPDLPGFGGMDSFSKIGRRPSIDNYADYLAAFLKMRYRRRRVTIVGISFGFVVVTRMLQRYPELVKKVDLLVSVAGFMHRDDFTYTPARRRLLRYGGRLLAVRPVAWLTRYILLNHFIFSRFYTQLPAGQQLLQTDPEESRLLLEFDLKLWQANDVRSHWLTVSECLQLDNCRAQVGIPVWQIASRQDPHINHAVVKEHMLVVFSDCQQVLFQGRSRLSILADKKELAVLLPRKLRQALAQEP